MEYSKLLLSCYFGFYCLCATLLNAQDSGCRDYTWITIDYSFSNANSINTTILINVPCVSICLNYCIQNSTCNAVDWNVLANVPQCTLISTNGEVTNGVNNNITNHFKLIRNLPSCDPGTKCLYSWFGYAFSHSLGAVGSNEANLDACISKCQNTASCQVVDWDPSNEEDETCWTNAKTFPDTKTGDLVYRFQKFNCNYFGASTAAPGGNESTSSYNCTSLLTSSATATTRTTTIGQAPVIGYYTTSSNDQPFAIKPAYIVLAGLGAGCVLLVIVAVVILCQYRLHADEKVAYNGFSNGNTDRSNTINAYRLSTVESYGMADASGGETIVESNPYYTHDNMDKQEY